MAEHALQAQGEVSTSRKDPTALTPIWPHLIPEATALTTGQPFTSQHQPRLARGKFTAKAFDRNIMLPAPHLAGEVWADRQVGGSPLCSASLLVSELVNSLGQ